MSDAKKKVRGVADIVFLIDVTGSMQPCIDALKNNIAAFVDALSKSDANNSSPISDWRGRVVGYRDYCHDGEHGWLEVHPFVRDAAMLKTQLASLNARGGGDEPESLLDALSHIADIAESPKGEANESSWRAKGESARFIIAFTDATYHTQMSIPGAAGGELTDAVNRLMSARIQLVFFAPDLPCYEEMASTPKSIYEPIRIADGLTAQQALAAFTKDEGGFRRTIEKLGRTVSQSTMELPAD